MSGERAREMLASLLDDPANMHGLRHIDVETCLAAIAQAHAAGMREAAEIAGAEGDDIERHADLARNPWRVGRLGMARAIGAGIRERIATSAGGDARAALAPASSEGKE